MAETPGPTRRTTASIALITLGLLILVPSGLCTGYVGLPMVGELIFGANPAYAAALLPFVLLIGGIPIALGAILLRLGLRSGRRSGRP